MKEKQGWFSLQGDKERKTDLDGKFSQTQRGRGPKKKSKAPAHLGRRMRLGGAESRVLHRQKVVSFVLKVDSAALSAGTL